MEDIRKFLGEVVPATAIKPWLRAPLQAAYQSYSSVATSGRPYGEASAVVTLRFNRVEHAQRVMATPVPEGAWTCTEASADSANLLDHVLSIDRPCLVNATVEFSAQDAEIAALCAYGSQPKRSVLRAWMSQPEIDWLIRAAQDRLLAEGDTLWDRLAQAPVWGEVSFTLPARPSRPSRASRAAPSGRPRSPPRSPRPRSTTRSPLRSRACTSSSPSGTVAGCSPSRCSSA